MPSPTFTLVQSYDTPRLPVSAFRSLSPEKRREMEELGFDDALDDGAVLVEWPERAPNPAADGLHVRLACDGADAPRPAGQARRAGGVLDD